MRKLPELLKSRIYVGISAGSICAAPTLEASSRTPDATLKINTDDKQGLGLVDFNLRPHMNNPHFPQWDEKGIAGLAEKIKGTLYGIDDQTVIKVVDGQVEIISEGKYIKLNN